MHLGPSAGRGHARSPLSGKFLRGIHPPVRHKSRDVAANELVLINVKAGGENRARTVSNTRS